MEINKECPLVLRGLYSYDVVSAYPSILKKFNYDFGDVDLDNKAERNRAIGIAQINNSEMSNFLSSTIQGILDFFLTENKIEKKEIISIQKDGFILTRKLTTISGPIEMTYRGLIDFLIISIDRKKMLYSKDFEIEVRGISRKYGSIEKWYQKFLDLNLYDKNGLFKQLYSLKNNFINSSDKDLFLIPTEDDFIVATKDLGDLQVSNPDFINVNDIDRMKYYQHYIQPFFQPLFITYY